VKGRGKKRLFTDRGEECQQWGVVGNLMKTPPQQYREKGAEPKMDAGRWGDDSYFVYLLRK